MGLGLGGGGGGGWDGGLGRGWGWGGWIGVGGGLGVGLGVGGGVGFRELGWGGARKGFGLNPGSKICYLGLVFGGLGAASKGRYFGGG